MPIPELAIVFEHAAGDAERKRDFVLRFDAAGQGDRECRLRAVQSLRYAQDEAVASCCLPLVNIPIAPQAPRAISVMALRRASRAPPRLHRSMHVAMIKIFLWLIDQQRQLPPPQKAPARIQIDMPGAHFNAVAGGAPIGPPVPSCDADQSRCNCLQSLKKFGRHQSDRRGLSLAFSPLGGNEGALYRSEFGAGERA